MAYQFDKIQVSSIKKQKQADQSEVLKVTLSDNNRLTVPLEDDASKKLRPGVIVSGFFSHMMEWAVDTGGGEKLKGTSLVGAKITKVEKGAWAPVEADSEIEDVDWSQVAAKDAFVQKPANSAVGAGKAGGEVDEVDDVPK